MNLEHVPIKLYQQMSSDLKKQMEISDELFSIVGYYADTNNWVMRVSEDGSQSPLCPSDRGELARKALRKFSKDQP